MGDLVLKEFNNAVTKMGDTPSYGGKSLKVNVANADKAISKVQYTERLWNKSRSQWMLKMLTCSQADGWMRLRQISAEMARKRMALNEAKFNYLKRLAKADVKKEKLQSLLDEGKISPAKQRLMEIEIAELEAQADEILPKMEGALKEVETLAEMHDQLKGQLGEINEEEFERAQTKSHIKRAMVQSLRDIRECGQIRAGNQEYLEQCGVNVSSAIKLCHDYLNQERENEGVNTTMLHDFLNQVSEILEPVAEVQAGILGYDLSTNNQLTYTPKESNEE